MVSLTSNRIFSGLTPLGTQRVPHLCLSGSTGVPATIFMSDGMVWYGKVWYCKLWYGMVCIREYRYFGLKNVVLYSKFFCIQNFNST